MSVGLLWLEGPLQSWGHDSRFGRRATLPFPTRSGVYGLICSALGRSGEQREWLASMRHYKQEIIAFARNAVPAAPLLRDFHMAGAGYALDDPWQDMQTPKTSAGKHPVGTGARLTWRFYLQDMAFACIVELPPDEDFGSALQNPVWPLCLGRRCCIPSDLIWRGEFPDFQQAIARARALAEAKNRHEIFRVTEELSPGAELLTLNDVPVVFGPYKEYADRQVALIRAE